MKKNSKGKNSNNEKDMDTLLKKLIEKAMKWEAEMDSLYNDDPLDQEFGDNRNTNKDNADN